MSVIFETHAHYEDEAFDEDRDELIKSLPESGHTLNGCPDGRLTKTALPVGNPTCPSVTQLIDILLQ